MSGLLEVIALQAADAERAEAGGADRIELVGTMASDGLSPEPVLVGQVRRATSLPIRVMLRLREGFGTDGGEVTRLKGLLSSYRSVGADGVVLGFLNGHTEIDAEVVLRSSARIRTSAGPSTGRSTPASPPTRPGGRCGSCRDWTRCSPPDRRAAWPRDWTSWWPGPGSTSSPGP